MINDLKQLWKNVNNKDTFNTTNYFNKMNVLKIATAGSVDDGKSTLIGRLLYDTKSLTDDKLEAIKNSSNKLGYDYLDFSLATDGLVAEREQGITIDVANIYFSTDRRSYIIADTPGHVEYTRNMVTGSSTAQVAIILIDARKGVLEQTYRHYFINQLLQVQHIIVAINKMDLVDYDEEIFLDIKKTFEDLRMRSDSSQDISYIPICALNGDNVVDRSSTMQWYQGETLLEYLENIQYEEQENTEMRFPIQTVIRPKKQDFHDFRGYAGKVYSGSIAVGDQVSVLPSMTQTVVKSIEHFDRKYQSASKGSSVVITLEDDVNVSRGDLIARSDELPPMRNVLKASVCWMDNTPLIPGKKYQLQHGINKVLAIVKQIDSVYKPDLSGTVSEVSELVLNEIGQVHLKLSKPIYADRYTHNRANGAFIIIDPQTNNTAGVGFVLD